MRRYWLRTPQRPPLGRRRSTQRPRDSLSDFPRTKYRVAANTTQWRASKEKAFACCDSNEKLHLPTPRRFEREPRVRRSVDRSECASDDAARTNGKQLWPFLYTIRPHKAAHNAFRTRVPQETLIRPLPGAPRHSSKRLAESAC